MSSPNEHGGYRAPAKPAPVSGPGKLSRRTDGQPMQSLPDAAYGEQKTYRQDQAGAPMSEANPVGGPAVSPLDMSRVVPMSAGSAFPDEPVTAGADAGPGASSAVLRGQGSPDFAAVVGLLPTLEIMASMPDASESFRQYVRAVRGMS